jgi:hypothetical protein
MSRMRWVCKVVTAMPWEFSFWIRIVAISDGIFGGLGRWSPTSSAIIRSNMFLASSFGWAVVACYLVHEGYNSKSASFDQEEESRFLLKESMLDTISENEETREEICRASKILTRLRDKASAGPIVEPQLRRTSSTLTALKHLATHSKNTILSRIRNREGSLFRGQETPPSQVIEEKNETSSETQSHEI